MRELALPEQRKHLLVGHLQLAHAIRRLRIWRVWATKLWSSLDFPGSGIRRNDRYEGTPQARARKQFYEATVRAVTRAPYGVRAGVRKDGHPKYRPLDSYSVSYAQPFDYGITAPSPELMRFEQRMRSDEWEARRAYARLMRGERDAGITAPLTLGQIMERTQ